MTGGGSGIRTHGSKRSPAALPDIILRRVIDPLIAATPASADVGQVSDGAPR